MDKYAVSFIYDVGTYLETLDKVEQMGAVMFVPAHADVCADMKQLVRYNRDKVHEVADRFGFTFRICALPHEIMYHFPPTFCTALFWRPGEYHHVPDHRNTASKGHRAYPCILRSV